MQSGWIAGLDSPFLSKTVPMDGLDILHLIIVSNRIPLYTVQPHVSCAISVEKGTFPLLAAPGLYRVPSNVSYMRSMIRQGSTLADVLCIALFSPQKNGEEKERVSESQL